MLFSQSTEEMSDLVMSDEGKQVQELDERLNLQLKMNTFTKDNQDLLIRLASGDNYQTIAESRKCTVPMLKSRVNRLLPKCTGKKVLGGHNLKSNGNR
jgi:hypothetical protein